MAVKSCAFIWAACFILMCHLIDIPADGAGAGMSEQEQMAWLANAVYKFRTPIAGWELVAKLQLNSRCTNDKDNFAIYRYPAAKQCVLAIAGTDTAADMLDNFDGRAVSDCGVSGIHSGYMGEVNDLLRACGFQNQFLPLLSGESCRGGISVVGHSLGGGVASVFAVCANNPLKPYGFNVSKLWTFGAPAVSAPHSLPNALSSNGCFPGARIWNQDRFFIDPIPGLSRGLNFVHPQVKAIRLTEITSFGMGSGTYEEVMYSCGSWQGFELPNPTDATPNPALHLMSDYCARTRQIYTNESFSSPAVLPSAVAPSEDLVDCSVSVNYTYAQVALFESTRNDFDGWGHTFAGYASSYTIGVLCSAAAVWGFHRMRIVADTRKALNNYYEKSHLIDFFDQCKAELDEQKPEDPLMWIIKYARERRADNSHALHPHRSKSTQEQIASPLLYLCRCCRCARRRKSRRRHRSVHVQFFYFVTFLGCSMLGCAGARHLLDIYHKGGDSMGRRWFDDKSEWMFPWTVGVVLLAPASMSALGLVLTFLSYPDWTVLCSHIVGFSGAACELQMMWSENLSNSGKVAGVLSVGASGIAIIELIVFLCRHCRSKIVGTTAGSKCAVVWLLIGIMFFFLGHCALVAAPCEFPHNNRCPFPEVFNVNAVYHTLIAGAVVIITMSMAIKIRASDSERLVQLSRSQQSSQGVTHTSVVPIGIDEEDSDK